MTEYNTLQLEVANKIGTLTINRPKSLNALNAEVLSELEAITKEIGANQDIQVLVITGAGEKAFVAGADIKEMAEKNALEGHTFSELGNRAFAKIATLRQPVIAAVNGYALGGGLELALSADIRIASTNAKVGQPEVGLGIIPGFGGTQRLSRLVGLGKAKELIFTANNIDAGEGLRIGLFNQVVEADALLDTAYAMAEKINKNAPLAVESAKVAIDKGFDITLDQGLAFEAQSFGLLFATKDQKAGMQAFINKEKAQFTKE
ncbi:MULTISPECIES: enoyl-CoA hydratase-related protein [Enterococcus]|uniref:enoyl-CoA hydratase-related protein n=1 Tax=Enterococcus TaxID=1350 RepID=UPI0021E733C9|nr:enoyl-CoA hydratase-related protein [Enterococcus hirae]MCV3097183.1 enoyl-CoA hydratase-related protein [Enterococcus hirae]MCV3104838.1 enoyl-CoA hydratase-related protein [Enterococcus hirae]MCV3109784.1 enoyl-CoA hydratase-related protein [Enterococcus hirae]MCV3124775.1 enoyl-CoA hydratase-related protein [Enterococcus hirae]MCV3129783.1 enoyl-CoA hydratase-related protein [Enterococcus hirae]